MEKQKFINVLLYLAIGCVGVSCTTSRTADEELLKEKLIGSWAGILNDEETETYFLNDSIYMLTNYAELHFLSDSTYLYFNYPGFSILPSHYSWINKDTVQLSIQNYGISIKGDTLLLSGKDKFWKYERILPKPASLTDEIFEEIMFMARRCNFLTLKRILPVPEARKQLKGYLDHQVVLDTMIIEEDIISWKRIKDSLGTKESPAEFTH